MRNTTIECGDVITGDTYSYLTLQKSPAKFLFRLQSENGMATGTVDLSDTEYEVFNSVFQRMVDNSQYL